MRRQSFLLFELGLRPAEVAAMLRTKRTNAYRYFQQWKRMPPLYQEKYQLMKGYFRKLNKRDRMALAQIFAVELGTSVEEVVNQMNKPS